MKQDRADARGLTRRAFLSLGGCESGNTAIEYGLIVGGAGLGLFWAFGSMRERFERAVSKATTQGIFSDCLETEEDLSGNRACKKRSGDF